MANTVLHKADSRGHAKHGWLDSHHSFSFGHYYDPERIHFGALRVLNDDIVKGGMGFGKHPHDNMEIISIPLRGALQHNDDTGRNEIIKTGDVQIMSAGTGIFHSEFNASKTDDVNFLQVWVFPKEKGIDPRYEQKSFDVKDRENQLQLVVSPDKDSSALWINQDSWFSLGDIEKGKELNYRMHKKENGIYVFILEGSAIVNDQKLENRDGLGVWDTNEIMLKAESDARVLLMEVPMNI
jgi:redox-sensitive bicupin YhaK (pirin superfamily)